MYRATFALPPVGQTGPVTVNGHEVPGVTGYTLTYHAGDIATLELDMAVVTDEPVAGEARIIVTPQAREGLLALGWTPPATDTEKAIEINVLAPRPGVDPRLIRDRYRRDAA